MTVTQSDDSGRVTSVSTRVREQESETFFSNLCTHKAQMRLPHGAAQTPQTVDLIKQCEIN